MKKQTQIIQILVILIVILTPMLLLAQVPVGDPGAGNSGDPEGVAPIDGGLSLLVAVGVGYGAKKLKERRAKRQEDDRC